MARRSFCWLAALAASIGPGAKISLKPSSGLSAGKFRIKVSDRSATDGFRLAGPGVTKSTSAKFKGSVTWAVTLKAGKYTFGSLRHPKLRRTFTVSSSGRTSSNARWRHRLRGRTMASAA